MRIAILLSLVLVGCSGAAGLSRQTRAPASAATGPVNVADEATEAMAVALDELGTLPLLVGNELGVAGHRMAINVVIEEEGEWEEGLFASVAAFYIQLDGHQVDALTTRALGLGVDESGARRDLVSTWMMGAGLPIGFAIASREFPERVRPLGVEDPAEALFDHFKLDIASVFVGAMLLRGNAPMHDAAVERWDQLRVEIAQAGVDYIPLQERYSTLAVRINVEGARVVAGECLIDGAPSQELYEHLAGLSWPAGDYVYRRTYVVVWPE